MHCHVPLLGAGVCSKAYVLSWVQLAQLEGMLDGCGCGHMNVHASARSQSTGKRRLPAWLQLTETPDMLLLQVNTACAENMKDEEHEQKHSQRTSCSVVQLTPLAAVW